MHTKWEWITEVSENGESISITVKNPRKQVYLKWGRREIHLSAVGTYHMIHCVIDTVNLVHTWNALERGM